MYIESTEERHFVIYTLRAQAQLSKNLRPPNSVHLFAGFLRTLQRLLKVCKFFGKHCGQGE